MKAPAFLRRNLAIHADDQTLVGLACDDNLWVRREAVRNPATPRWVLDLLIRAGADPELRGRGEPDPDMSPDDLRRLVECGPWARLLVGDHPNTSDEVLDVLARQPDRRLRIAAARHPNSPPAALAHLCADADPEIRATALANPRRPDGAVDLLRRAGSEESLDGLAPAGDVAPDAAELEAAAELGPWGRFLAARHRACPRHVLVAAATDQDWRVSSALLDNPAVPDDVLERIVDETAEFDDLRALANLHAEPTELARLARHPLPTVRLAAARHPATPRDVIAVLATDRSADVRRVASAHPQLDPRFHDLLVRAGSSADLTRLDDLDDDLDDDLGDDLGPSALDDLARGGHWARQLAVRHPATPPAALARLLCDDDPKLREWAGAHPAAPPDVIDDIRRAGGAIDFQGVAEGDPDAPVDLLRRVAEHGPWGAWVVSWHSNAPSDLRRRPD